MDRVCFDDILGTNYAPTYNERCFIKALVESMEQELSSLNQDLLAKRDKLNDRILAHKALLTPARRLMPELVEEIFTLATHSDRSGGSRLLCSYPRASAAPLKLGRICRRWRQIALTTPSLWAAVEIPFGWGVNGLTEWIRRAGSCTLFFSVDIRRTNFEVLKVLASCQNRWKGLTLHFVNSPDGRQLFKDFLELLSCSYDNLQTLDIQCTWPRMRQPGHPTNIEMCLGVKSAPKLRSLSLHTPDVKTVTAHALPFPLLREIKILFHPIPATDFLTLLRLSPAVEHASAHVIQTSDESDSRQHIHTLAHLRDIEILEENNPSGGSPSHRLCLLEMFDLPALERLSYRFPGLDPGIARTLGPKVKFFIYRSRPPLKVLRIHGCRIPPADVVYCVPLLPNLTCLDIDHVGDSDDWDGVIQCLTGPIPPVDDDLSGCVCAQLREISLRGGSHTVSRLVIKMILSRSPAGRSKLSQVTVLSCSEREVSAHPKIKDCVKNGLKFKGGGDRADEWGWGNPI